MPKYQIGSQPYYGKGKFVPAGGKVTLQPHEEPSRSWTPLDKEASAAIAKLKKQDQDREKLKTADLSKVDPKQLAELIDSAAKKQAEVLFAKFREEQEAKSKASGDDSGPPAGAKGRASDNAIS